ncbi:hypothetical protein O3G_MSEX015146 [Manduca sexta]|uniref:Aldehyde oxidase/xanthine dehydrogenase second molybdopterin binding domain-containing protein n=2 Tax=Manduca sexta TaxID=7130 RepID=A0A921ZZI2_MANSE|nr:hypothetical protein O3G_MSEX015146 [Manduca sexta]
MGLGYWLTEELIFNKDTGELLTDSTWTYHVPQARDIPQDMTVYFRKNSYSDRLILGSKCIGEPPYCLSVAIPLALREAISLARAESGIPITQWFEVDGPYTVEKICMSTATKLEDMKFH